MAAVPPDFGLRGGTPISNAAAILPQIDQILRTNHPPAVEFIYVEPTITWRVLGIDISRGPHGHAALRWTMPEGQQRLMSIVEPELVPGGRNMVYLVDDPADYFFGVGDLDRPLKERDDQGGIYNRHMIGLRIEHLPAANIVAIDQFAQKLRQAYAGGIVDYCKIRLLSRKNCGGCTYWPTRALVAAGILQDPISFPKAAWVSLYEDDGIRTMDHRKAEAWNRTFGVSRMWSPGSRLPTETETETSTGSCQTDSNIHVVAYKEIQHAHRSYGFGPTNPSLLRAVAPGVILENIVYWNLSVLADVRVVVPPGSIAAVVSRVIPDEDAPYRSRNGLVLGTLMSFILLGTSLKM